MPQIQSGYILVASIIAAVMGLTGIATIQNSERSIDIALTPEKATHVLGAVFEVTVVVRSDEPVNVFSGKISFNKEVLAVERIDYNTSIADLWAEEPWYANGDGTIGFAGGSTRSGGFTGTDTLMRITFKTLRVGDAELHLFEERILKHDGLGTDAETGNSPIDALFTIEPERLALETKSQEAGTQNTIVVLKEPQSTDLNGDGKYSFQDVSVFMVHLGTQDLRSDLSGDSKVSIADLSILLNEQ
jgi:hypothetical protein